MKRILFLLLTFSSFQVLAQEGQLTGKVMDTTEKKPLQYAVVSLLFKNDSTLAGFRRTDKEGNFSFNQLTNGRYIVLVSFPKFADLTDEYVVSGKTDLGMIALTPRSALLEEVIVRSGQAIRIKGDTTEFTADSFMVKDGATVEDLMKKLPGFQVNSKGEITAQGKRVDKVLVDGEEFFGDDPTMATQNISSKAVDKVQVYDTKTEQQNITGISSGNDGKTINIKLKENAKKGSFGKAHVGSDFSDYHDAKALYNQFIGKKKFSVYGTKSTLNTGSLNWEERQKMGIEQDMEYDEIGGYYFSFGTDDGFNDWNLRGLPDSYSAGTLYSNKFNEDRQGLNLSYRFNRMGTENVGSKLSQNLRTTGTDYRNVFTNTNGWNEQHAVNGKFEWKLDSLTSLKLTTSGIRRINDVFAKTNTEYLDANKLMKNNSDQSKISESTKLQSDNVFTYRQMFNKKNRLLIATMRFGYIEDDQEGTLTTVANFYKGGNPDSTSIIDQLKTFDGNSRTIGGKVTFSEPLNDKLSVVLDYAYNTNHSSSYRNSFNKSSGGKYDVLDPLYSNNFELEATSNSTLAILKYAGKKTKFAFGSGISSVKLDLADLDSAKTNEYDFLKFTPQAQIGYTIKPQTNISFTYRGTTRQPTINQLQPLKDNSDPLYVFSGNPDLKLGFNHSFSMFFNQYKVLARRGIWLSTSYSVTNNAIVNSILVDTATGRQTYSPLNVNGITNWSVYGSWNKGGGDRKLGYGFNVNANGGNNINFMDQVRNETQYAMLNAGFSLSYERSEKYSIEMRPQLGYNFSESSIQVSAGNNYFSYGGWLTGYVTLPGKLELRSELNFDLRERTERFNASTNIINWNAHISKKIFKDKSGKIYLMANDLLKQNKGFNRIINSSVISEDRYSRVGQYFLLKFEWSFNKMTGAK